jgi:hypothetical protein
VRSISPKLRGRPYPLQVAQRSFTSDGLALNEEVLGFTNIWCESTLRHASGTNLPSGAFDSRQHHAVFLGDKKWKHFVGAARWIFGPITNL